MSSTPQWLDRKAAEQYIGVNADKIRRLVNDGALRCYQDKKGAKLRFRRRDLDAYLASIEVKRGAL